MTQKRKRKGKEEKGSKEKGIYIGALRGQEETDNKLL